MMDPWQKLRQPMAQTSQPGFLQRNSDALLQAGIGLMTGPTAQQQLAMSGMGFLQGRQQSRERNRTVEWLQRTNPQLADAVQAGMPVADAYKMALQAQTAEKKNPYMNVDGQLFNYQTGEWTQPPQTEGRAIDKDDWQRSRDTRRDYFGDDDVKTYSDVRNAYERVRASAQADSGPGDLGLIFNYMKMLDPASVVREGEFATAENAGGVSNRVRNLYNRTISGERLTPELRQEFVTAADSLYAETAGNLESVNERYQRVGDDWQVDVDRFIMEPEQYEPLQLGQTRTVPSQSGQITIKRVR